MKILIVGKGKMGSLLKTAAESAGYTVTGMADAFDLDAVNNAEPADMVIDFSHRDNLDHIDQQIAALHNQNPKTFFSAVMSEFTCRVCSALEIYFVLRVLMTDVSYFDCILILAFTTLFANMLFFMPLQLGGREGGFLMSVKGLAMSTDAAILVALLVRIRELIWTAIGLLLIKVGSDAKEIAKSDTKEIAKKE